MSTAMDCEVSLHRPFPVEYAGDLWRWLNSPRAPNFDDFGPKSYSDFRLDLSRRTSEITWAIRFGDGLAGYLAFLPHTSWCGMFHGMVIAPELRKLGIGTEAAKLATAELVALGFGKLIVWTFADNQPVAGMFGNLGYKQEGYITAATQRQGKPLDMRVMCFGGSR